MDFYNVLRPSANAYDKGLEKPAMDSDAKVQFQGSLDNRGQGELLKLARQAS